MKKYATAFLHKLVTFLEILISFILGICTLLITFQLIAFIKNVPFLDMYPNYDDMLKASLSLIIGVELIRMLYQHTPSVIFEVLLFAIARQIIVDHSNPLTGLIGVLSIAILFAIRKFLFDGVDETTNTIFSSRSRIRTVNRVLPISIPYEAEETLLDLLLKTFEETNTPVKLGASAEYKDFILRVAKMQNGTVTKIEVTHSAT